MRPVTMKPGDVYVNGVFPVPTPPPSGSPFELAPIIDLATLSDNRPPSPSSPTKSATAAENDIYTHRQSPPAFLEPRPLLDFLPASIRPQLFIPLPPALQGIEKRKREPLQKIPSIQIPLSYPIPQPVPEDRYLQPKAPFVPSKDDLEKENRRRKELGSSPSPTMAAAAATAAAAAQRRPSTTVSSPFLGQCIMQNPSADDKGISIICADEQSRVTGDILTNNRQRALTEQYLTPRRSTFTANKRNQSVDQSMFLTKNAHIKRPRNAWIHFRCHYGQALKAQDPTLRAEEISKRASRRWSKLLEAEKKPWHELAEQEKQAHKQAFPEYRYCPKRSSTSVPSTPCVASGPCQLSDFEADERTQKRAKRSKIK